ncbi:MAG: hypothetical protein IIX05_06225, partial [Selenomonadaceae bacterium]|nr:hypothetical protein [Selenomonadaceae bacterium]
MMKNGLISWLEKEHIAHECEIDKILGPMAFVVRQDGYIKVHGANAVFEKLLGWTNYQWSQGMDAAHLLPPEALDKFGNMLDRASRKVFVEFSD